MIQHEPRNLLLCCPSEKRLRGRTFLGPFHTAIGAITCRLVEQVILCEAWLSTKGMSKYVRGDVGDRVMLEAGPQTGRPMKGFEPHHRHWDGCQNVALRSIDQSQESGRSQVPLVRRGSDQGRNASSPAKFANPCSLEIIPRGQRASRGQRAYITCRASLPDDGIANEPTALVGWRQIARMKKKMTTS